MAGELRHYGLCLTAMKPLACGLEALAFVEPRDVAAHNASEVKALPLVEAPHVEPAGPFKAETLPLM